MVSFDARRGERMKPFIQVFFCAFLFFSIPLGADEIHHEAILLDASKSVSKAEFERIKGRIQELIQQQHNPSLHLALYIFGNSLQKISVDRLPSIEATQTTTIFYDALYDVLQSMNKETSGAKSIVIFSDGKDTRSATILEDIVSYAREQKIVIHCVGMGKANQRLLERLAKLTGGKYFAAENSALLEEIRNTIDVAPVPQNPISSPAAIPPLKKPLPNSPLMRGKEHSSPRPASKETVPYGWIAAFAGVLLVSAILIYRRRGQKRRCPVCGKLLEPSQLVCSDCPGQTQIQPRPEIPLSQSDPIHGLTPPRAVQSSQETQELLSKTHFLDETPALVVTKGKNIGEKYRLSKDQPVSIGRSRLNEIRPDDPSISAQHCRIIPEKGEYMIYDLGSTNGTVVNNVNVNMAVLEEGDMIRVGATTLMFTLSGT